MQKNPFELPGLGLNADNPLLSSLNAMQKLWADMAKVNNVMGLTPTATEMMSVEDLAKRIEELRAVENWLRLNLSMLSNLIQGLEIQRSTFAAIQGLAQGSTPTMPTMADLMQNTATGTDPEAASASAAELQQHLTQNMQHAGQAWWSLVQNQLEGLSQAATQSMQQAQTMAEEMSATASTAAQATASGDSTFNRPKTAAKKTTAASASKKTATKKSAKKATKKTTPKE